MKVVKPALILFALIILLGGGYLLVSSLMTSDKVARNADRSSLFHVNGNGTPLGLANSADKVRFEADWLPSSSGTRIPTLAIKLDIAKGWHVNAHPASLEFLIPTVISGSLNGQPVNLDIQYPPGVDSGIRLDGKAIQVYNSGVTIMMHPEHKAWELTREAGQLTVVLRVQSCSDQGTCLAPSTLSKTVTLPKRLSRL